MGFRLHSLGYDFDVRAEKIAMEFAIASFQRHLAKLMKMSLRRKRLRHDTMLLHYTDMAMLREGVENMTDFELERVSLNYRLATVEKETFRLDDMHEQVEVLVSTKSSLCLESRYNCPFSPTPT